MQHISSALSDADIAAVSAWFAAQPARLPERAR
jgi:cytochrome c553